MHPSHGWGTTIVNKENHQCPPFSFCRGGCPWLQTTQRCQPAEPLIMARGHWRKMPLKDIFSSPLNCSGVSCSVAWSVFPSGKRKGYPVKAGRVLLLRFSYCGTDNGFSLPPWADAHQRGFKSETAKPCGSQKGRRREFNPGLPGDSINLLVHGSF